MTSSQSSISVTEGALAQLNEVILGKDHQLRLALTCLLARGHLLIEDLPGMGKTTLAHALAQTLGLQFQRIQFTSDLLPADILGVSIYEQEAHRFSFHPGPVFSQVILADEINRATPKTQSALLEAMEEQQVTVEGETRRLPEPFFVIATQNPAHQIGTFPLPESQLDRFLMRLEMGYPDAQAERELLKGMDRRDMLETMGARMNPRQLVALQHAVNTVKVADPLIDYLQAILQYTREPARYSMALSPRGGLALMRAAQAWALLAGRDYAIPEDVQAVLPAVAGHRLHPMDDDGLGPNEVVARLIEQVPIP